MTTVFFDDEKDTSVVLQLLDVPQLCEHSIEADADDVKTITKEHGIPVSSFSIANVEEVEE